MAIATDSLETKGRDRDSATAAILVLLLLAAVLATLGLWYHQAGQAEPSVDLDRPAAAGQLAAWPPRQGDALRFAVATMWSVESTFSRYHELVKLIADRVGRHETFVVRSSYRALRRALEHQEVEVAFVCTGPYLSALPSGQVELLVQPVFMPGIDYRCELIVPQDSQAKTYADLANHTIAFSDPESFTGCLVLTRFLIEQGTTPPRFFSKIVFAGSHEQSIRAVTAGIVDAAAVHSVVLASAKREDPGLSQRLRTLWQSEVFGLPPVLVARDIDPGLRERLRDAFVSLHHDPAGQAVLTAMGILRFETGREEDYATAQALYQEIQAHPEVTKWLSDSGRSINF